MSSTNKTSKIELSQFVPSDRPTFGGDYNHDMHLIDNAFVAVALDTQEVKECIAIAQSDILAVSAVANASQSAANINSADILVLQSDLAETAEVANSSAINVVNLQSDAARANEHIEALKTDVDAVQGVVDALQVEIDGANASIVATNSRVDATNDDVVAVGAVAAAAQERADAAYDLASAPSAEIAVHNHSSETTGGAIPFTSVTGVVPIAQGGTGATTAAAARTNLGVGGGVGFQSFDWVSMDDDGNGGPPIFHPSGSINLPIPANSGGLAFIRAGVHGEISLPMTVTYAGTTTTIPARVSSVFIEFTIFRAHNGRRRVIRRVNGVLQGGAHDVPQNVSLATLSTNIGASNSYDERFFIEGAVEHT